MGMSEFYGAVDDEKSRELLREAARLGCTFWDTASTVLCRVAGVTDRNVYYRLISMATAITRSSSRPF